MEILVGRYGEKKARCYFKSSRKAVEVFKFQIETI